jgi:hypothetical protein
MGAIVTGSIRLPNRRTDDPSTGSIASTWRRASEILTIITTMHLRPKRDLTRTSGNYPNDRVLLFQFLPVARAELSARPTETEAIVQVPSVNYEGGPYASSGTPGGRRSLPYSGDGEAECHCKRTEGCAGGDARLPFVTGDFVPRHRRTAGDRAYAVGEPDLASSQLLPTPRDQRAKRKAVSVVRSHVCSRHRLVCWACQSSNLVVGSESERN